MHYLTCTLQPGSGLAPGVVFSRVVSELHLHHAGNFGIVFPNARSGEAREFNRPKPPSLGESLHIFTNGHLMPGIRNLLERFSGYVHFSRDRPVPQTSGFVTVRRCRDTDKMTPAGKARLLRRAIRRGEQQGRPLSPEQIARLEQHNRRKAVTGFTAGQLPYLTINSLSTRSQMMLHFKTIHLSEPGIGGFDSYGFCRDGQTLPWIG